MKFPKLLINQNWKYCITKRHIFWLGTFRHSLGPILWGSRFVKMELMPGKGPLWSADSASIEEKLSDGVLSREFKHAASHWCNSCFTLFYAGGLLGCGNIMLPKCSRWLVKPELLLDHCVRLTRAVQASSLPSCIFMGYRKRRRSRLWRENGPGLIRIFIPQRAGSPEWRAGLMTIHEMALI